MTYYKKKTYVPISKERRILSQICKECGRTGLIPMSFCNECWKEMYKTFNKEENNE